MEAYFSGASSCQSVCVCFMSRGALWVCVCLRAHTRTQFTVALIDNVVVPLRPASRQRRHRCRRCRRRRCRRHVVTVQQLTLSVSVPAVQRIHVYIHVRASVCDILAHTRLPGSANGSRHARERHVLITRIIRRTQVCACVWPAPKTLPCWISEASVERMQCDRKDGT